MKLLLPLQIATATPALAALRFGCETLTVQRLDPVVEPGNAPSAHVHQIVGGNAFNATVDTTVDVGERATCTTCLYSEDFSNYWTAVLYFRARNGTFKRVRQYANAPSLHDGQKAGMTIYYTQESFGSNGKQKIRSFPPVIITVPPLHFMSPCHVVRGYPVSRSSADVTELSRASE